MIHPNLPSLAHVNFTSPSPENSDTHPFSLNIIKNLESITFPQQVTFFVGETGTGKSTILESLAYKAGFGLEGGSKNIHFTTAEHNAHQATIELAEHMTLSWRKKPKNGYFFRAESFFNVANYIDSLVPNG